MGRFLRFSRVVVVSLLLVFPAVALAGPPSKMQTFLKNTQDVASVAAVATALTPGAQVAALVFTGIALGAAGLEIGFYSEDKVVDTIAVALSMVFRHKNPIIEDLVQRSAQEGIRIAGKEAQRQMNAGNNGSRNAPTSAPRNVCYAPGAEPVGQSVTMPGNASGAGTAGGSKWFRP